PPRRPELVRCCARPPDGEQRRGPEEQRDRRRLDSQRSAYEEIREGGDADDSQCQRERPDVPADPTYRELGVTTCRGDRRIVEVLHERDDRVRAAIGLLYERSNEPRTDPEG